MLVWSLASLAAVPVVRTPFGEVADGCTVSVPHGTHVEEGTDGLLLSHPTLGEWEHKRPAHCTSLPSRAAPVTCSSLPCNNWIDNAGWMQPNATRPIGGFSATYSVPATPSARGPGQTLFYFIGVRDTTRTRVITSWVRSSLPALSIHHRQRTLTASHGTANLPRQDARSCSQYLPSIQMVGAKPRRQVGASRPGTAARKI
jgi:hypothetical protein